MSESVDKEQSARILVVDDEEGMRDFLSIFLQREGHVVQTVGDGEAALEMIKSNSYDLVITDLKMPKMDGLEVLQHIRSMNVDSGVILITAYASTETAVDAMKDGAFDYIAKPFDVEEMKEVVNGALSRRRKGKRTEGPRREEPKTRFGNMIGVGHQMWRIFDLIPKVAATPTNVMITGESGTGKELVARAIHEHSPRSNNPIVTINCGGFPENLLESELFGYQKGAFTGAVGNKPGLLELANKGTVFMDEIGDLPLPLQVKLLRVTQDKCFQRIGGTEEIRIDVRFIGATNKNLEEAVIEGQFREDLYYRLNVIQIRMPPLRERKEDIAHLAEHFMAKYAREMGKDIQSLSLYSLEALKDYHFPGNVRELENIIQRAVALEQSKIILPESLKLASFKRQDAQKQSGRPEAPDIPPEGIDLEQHLMDIERALIVKALDRTGGVKTEAAKLLGISFRAFRYKMDKHQI